MSDTVKVDLHGLTEEDARILLDRLLRTTPRDVKKLLVVHGYRGGTVLRDLVRFDYALHPRVKELRMTDNPGETEMVLTPASL